MTTQQYCEECGKSDDLQEILGHHYCTGCLTAAMGGPSAVKEYRQLRLDPEVFKAEAVDTSAPEPADRYRAALDFEAIRSEAHEALLQEYAHFRSQHPWVKPGMVVVNVDTADLAVVRASTNPDIGWHLMYLTTAYALNDSIRAIVPSNPRLRIADPEEYDEARELLLHWPARSRNGLYIGQPDPDLFAEQFTALLTQQQEVN